MEPRFAARVAKVWLVNEGAGKVLFPSFSAKAGNPERQSAKHGPPLCSEGDEGEWARVTKVWLVDKGAE